MHSLSAKGSMAKRLILPLIVVLMLGIGFAPRQAVACCGDGAAAGAAISSSTGSQTTSLLAQWATEFTKWANQFALLTSIINGINTFTSTFNSGTNTLAALINGGQQAETEAAVRIGQGVADSANQSAAAAATAQVAGRVTPPPPGNEELCNVIRVRQGPVAARAYYDMTGAATARMVDNRYRGPGTDGTGEQYASDERSYRCGDVTRAPGSTPFANPIDGYPTSCVPSDRTLIDADLRYGTLSGTRVMEMPQLVPIPLSFPVAYRPTPLTYEQKMYVAGVSFCEWAAGPRPSPPNNKDLDSPEGVVQTAAFDHATALESAFVSQCTKRVAELTRPNCDDPMQYADATTKSVCDTTATAAQAYVKAGGVLTPDFPAASVWSGCTVAGTPPARCPGLSPHQASYLSHMTCTTSQYYTQAAGAGVSHGDLLDYSTICDLGVTAWMAQQADAEAALVEGFRGLQDIQGAYGGAGSTSGKTMRINAPDEKQQLPRDREEATLDLPAKKVVVKAGRAASLPQGVPFDADRISLPATLAQ